MKIKILIIGKTKESFIKQGEDEYFKKLRNYFDLEYVVLKNTSPLLPPSKIIKTETDKIIEYLTKSKNYYKVLLNVKGKQQTSTQFSQLLLNIKDNLGGKVLFIIRGPWGVDERINKQIDFEISFSNLTFTHEIIRILLLEQLFRAFEIIKGSTYHK